MIGVVFALVLVIWLWPSVWAKYTLGRVQVSVNVALRHVTIGEQVPLTITIRNTAWLPCPYVEAVLEMPEGLAADAEGTQKAVRVRTYLLMRQEVTFQTVCYAVHRGRQWFGQKQVTLHLNDGLGFQSVHSSHPMDGEVVVMPDLTAGSDLTPQVQALVGKREVTRWLHVDESLIRGIRTYTPGDPFKYIAWQASARVGKWMTKQFASSTEANVDLLLNAQCEDRHWHGMQAAEFDRLCSLAATWSRALEMYHTKCRFGTNAINPNFPKHRWFGEQRAEALRRLLGRLNAATACDFSLLLDSLESSSSPHPVIVVTSFLTQEQLRKIRRLIHAGYPFTVVTGPAWTSPLSQISGLTWVRTPNPEPREEATHA